MTPIFSIRSITVFSFSALLLAACGAQAAAPASTAAETAAATSSATSTPAATPTPTSTPTPTPTATATPAPIHLATATPAPTRSGSPVVLAQSVGNMGVLVVAASDGHTLYTFDSDSPGISRCSGSCAAIWPPLSLMAGEALSGGAGVTGALGTIRRSDGTVQVTYRGLPLYFFHNDTRPGDTFGDYTGWSLVHP